MCCSCTNLSFFLLTQALFTPTWIFLYLASLSFCCCRDENPTTRPRQLKIILSSSKRQVITAPAVARRPFRRRRSATEAELKIIEYSSMFRCKLEVFGKSQMFLLTSKTPVLATCTCGWSCKSAIAASFTCSLRLKVQTKIQHFIILFYIFWKTQYSKFHHQEAMLKEIVSTCSGGGDTILCSWDATLEHLIELMYYSPLNNKSYVELQQTISVHLNIITVSSGCLRRCNYLSSCNLASSCLLLLMLLSFFVLNAAANAFLNCVQSEPVTAKENHKLISPLLLLPLLWEAN